MELNVFYCDIIIEVYDFRSSGFSKNVCKIVNVFELCAVWGKRPAGNMTKR